MRRSLKKKVFSALLALSLLPQTLAVTAYATEVTDLPLIKASGYQDFPAYYNDSSHLEKQVTHPDVVVMDEAWNGYRYWAVYTPNVMNISIYENPSIVASNDGVNWTEPTGLTNPIEPQPSSTRYHINFGSAQVYIDDALVETVNVNGTIAANQILYENTELEYGEHTIKIVCLSATIDIDRFAYGGNPVDANYITIEEVDDCVQYSDNWVLEQNSVFSGNTAKYTSVAGSYVEFTFTGTAVCWYGQNDVNFGEAKVYIDNELVSTVNVNGVAVTGKKLFEKVGLNRAEHTLKIVCETPVIDVDYFQYVE